MRKIKDFVSHFFILSTLFLTIISIYAIWVNDARDLLYKSFSTVALFLLVGIIVVVASRYMHSNEEMAHIEEDALKEEESIQIFKGIRKATIALLIGFSSLLAFVGVLSIWEVIHDSKTLDKVLASIACLIFSSIIVIVVCLLRSKKESFGDQLKDMNGGDFIKVFAVGVFLFWFFAIMADILF